MPRTLIAAIALLLAAPGLASAATLTTDRQCYVDVKGQQIGVTGTGWAPGSAWGVIGGSITESGTADAAGGFAFQTALPTIFGDGIKPQKVRLSGTQDGAEIASTSFKVVEFLVAPKDISGKPTGKTSWGFSGFTPSKAIYIHVRRGGKTYTDRVGKGDKVCGTLRTRLRRLPAVPPSKIRFGRYKLYVDNRPKFSKGGLQFPATIRIRRVPA